MKKFFKVILWIIFIIIIISCAVLIYLHFTRSDRIDPLSRVPQDAVFIAETQNLTKTWEATVKTEFWQQLVTSDYLEEFRSDINYADSLLQYNKTISLLLKNRKIAFSIHQLNNEEYDFLCIIDLQDATRLTFITKAAKLLGYSVIEKIYNNYKLFELTDNETNDKYYVGIINNLLTFSFSNKIIQNSLNIEEEEWRYNLNFQEVKGMGKSNNLMKFYINYSQVASFYNLFMDDDEGSIEEFVSSIYYSAFDLTINDNRLNLTGFTNINDSLNSYIRAISKTAPSQVSAHSIIPVSTAAFISINFDDFDEFYTNLMNEYHAENAEDLNKYNKQIKNIESLLEINLQEDFFSWIGNEIMLIKIRPFPGYSKDEWMMSIHCNSKDKAYERLNHMVNKIDENSPLRYKSEEYKNFIIGNLNVSGMFNLLFGKLFESIDKPYFIFIEDFVLFANSPEVLKRFIDNYLKGKTLYQRSNYQAIFHELEYKGNITAYINMPNFYQYMYSYSNAENRKILKDKKNVVMGFSDIGCQLISKDGLINTIIATNYDASSSIGLEIEKMEEAVEFSLSNQYYIELEFVPFISNEDNPVSGKYTEYYTDSILKIEGLFKDSLMVNIWRSYYDNGNITSTVNYKDNIPDGIAYFYFNDNNQTTMAEMEFDNGRLEGNYIEYYSNGSRKAVIYYNKGLPDGEALYYYNTGTLKLEGKYKNGKKKGKWVAYTPNGEVMK